MSAGSAIRIQAVEWRCDFECEIRETRWQPSCWPTMVDSGQSCPVAGAGMATDDERVALLEERMDHQATVLADVRGSLADLRGELHGFRAETRDELAAIRRYFEQIDRRFEQVDRRFEQVDRRFEQVDHRFEQVDQRFVWLVG